MHVFLVLWQLLGQAKFRSLCVSTLMTHELFVCRGDDLINMGLNLFSSSDDTLLTEAKLEAVVSEWVCVCLSVYLDQRKRAIVWDS